MDKYIWLFPIIFIFHDMEEIIGYGLWLKKNEKLLGEKFPRFLNLYKDFSTEGFALAVYEELIVCIIVCTIAKYSNSCIAELIWLGSFIGCDFHFLIHIAQCIILRKYIPAFFTSVICLPISTHIVIQCIKSLNCDVLVSVVFISIGALLVAINLWFAQKLIGYYTRKMGISPLIK